MLDLVVNLVKEPVVLLFVRVARRSITEKKKSARFYLKMKKKKEEE